MQISDNPSNFEKPFEVVDLTKSHRNKHESLEERPQHNAGVCIVINCAQHHYQRITFASKSFMSSPQMSRCQ